MKKVLLVATVQSHIAQFHRPLAELLHAYGYEVHVAARNNLAEKNGMRLDFADKIYDVPFSRSPKSMENIRAYRTMKRILAREYYDIVHCNTPMGGIVARLAARKFRKKGTKVFYTAHGFHFYEGAPRKNWLIIYPVEKLFSRITDKLITINLEDYKLASEKFLCPVAHIHGVGVDETRYHPVSQSEKEALRKTMGFGNNQKIILCIGELLPNKNQSMAIQMMEIVLREYPDSVLLLAGNGPNRADLERLIEKMNLQEHVRLLDYCTCLEKYQQAADIVVSCSKREGLGLAVLEAMYYGNPVVATDNRGHRELIQSGETGYLVAVNDTEMMASIVIRQFQDVEKRKEMGLKACAFAKRYGSVQVKRELEAIYFPHNDLSERK